VAGQLISGSTTIL